MRNDERDCREEHHEAERHRGQRDRTLKTLLAALQVACFLRVGLCSFQHVLNVNATFFLALFGSIGFLLANFEAERLSLREDRGFEFLTQSDGYPFLLFLVVVEGVLRNLARFRKRSQFGDVKWPTGFVLFGCSDVVGRHTSIVVCPQFAVLPSKSKLIYSVRIYAPLTQKSPTTQEDPSWLLARIYRARSAFLNRGAASGLPVRGFD